MTPTYCICVHLHFGARNVPWHDTTTVLRIVAGLRHVMSQLIFLNKFVNLFPVSTDVHHSQPICSIYLIHWIKGSIAGAEDCLTQEIEAVTSMVPWVSVDDNISYPL